MLRHLFYALLGGYFVAGLVIGLNWLSAVDLGRREPTVAQDAERVLAPVQDNRTPGAESADVTDVIIGQALTAQKQKKSSDNREASSSPPPVAMLQPPHPDRRTAKGPANDTGTLGLRRPQSSGPQSLQAAQVDRGSLPTARAINQASTPHPRTDVTDVIIGQGLTAQRAETAKSSDNREASISPPPVAMLQPPHPDRRTAKGPANDTGTLGLRRPQSSGPQSLQAAQVDRGSLPTARAINQASTPHPRTDQPGSTSMPQTLQAAQVDTGALPTVRPLSRAQQGRLLEARREPVISGPSFGGTAEPAPTAPAHSDSIPPKAIRTVFALACSLLRPAFAAGKLSTGQGMEIGRMQDDYLKKAECLAAAKRATRIAKRKIGCRCTAETKELDAAAQAPPAAVDYKLLMEGRSRSRYFPRSKPRVE